MPRKIPSKPCRTCGSEERSAHGNCLPCQRTAFDKWKATHKYIKKYNPKNAAEHSRNTRARFPEKVKARRAVERAVNKGKLLRSEFCQLCLMPTKTEGHHENYAKPLEVVWLCTSCHKGIDGYKTPRKERSK